MVYNTPTKPRRVPVKSFPLQHSSVFPTINESVADLFKDPVRTARKTLSASVIKTDKLTLLNAELNPNPPFASTGWSTPFCRR
jgi:hypothetical protein